MGRRHPGRVVLFSFFLVIAVPAGPILGSWFIRGDVNGSSSLNVSDAIALLRHLFAGDPGPAACRDAADVDDNGTLEITDAVHLLKYLFLGGPSPVTLHSGCGADLSLVHLVPEDALDCTNHPACSPVAVVFVIDKSGTMAGGNKWSLVRSMVIAQISELSERDQLGLVFFDAQVTKFPASGQPADATPELKEAAIAFVLSVPLGSGTCSRPALITALNYANTSTLRSKSIYYGSDGFNTCAGQDPTQYGAQTLAEVTKRNTERVPIHAVCVGLPGFVDENWMKKLAAQNDGHFIRIVR